MEKNQQPDHRPITKTVANAAMASFEEMDRLFGELFSHRWPRSWLRPFRWEHPHPGGIHSAMGTLPRVDVLDREAEIVVRAELPGVRKEELDVWVDDQMVTIRACAGKHANETENYFRAEMPRGEFVRSVALPSPVDTGIARGKLENGILELILPKAENARRHTIKIE